MGTSLIVTMVISMPLGILAAVKQYSWADKIITTLATIGYALPSFVLGILLLYIFSDQDRHRAAPLPAVRPPDAGQGGRRR